MENQLSLLLNNIAYAITVISWIVFAFGFFFLKRRVPHKGQKKDKLALIGIILEGAGFALVFSIRREMLSDIVPMSASVELLLIILDGCLAAVSLLIALSAIKVLGKQWDYKAQIIEGHELIVSGPYKFVRHPIYSGMFGLLIVTGYSMTQLSVYIIAIILFLVGTIFRIKVEERLLIQHFGGDYKNYQKRVSAIIPFII